MLKKHDLFKLVKTLTTDEQRYIFSSKRNARSGEIGYTLIIKELLKMEHYSEEVLRETFKHHAFVKKLDVKKHYLFYWILRRLTEYYYKNNAIKVNFNNIDILIEKSLYSIAHRQIINLKRSLKLSEDYLSLITLIEKELSISKFIKDLKSEKIIDELLFYSMAYADYNVFQSLKHKFRNRIDHYTFVRSEKDLKHIEKIMSHPILSINNKPKGVLNTLLYNQLYYWNYVTIGNWKRSNDIALLNYKIVKQEKLKRISFIDEIVLSYYNLTISSIFTHNYKMVENILSQIKSISKQLLSSRMKWEFLFQYHLLELIYVNNVEGVKNIDKIIADAEQFISIHQLKFDNHRISNFYFDLAKAYFTVNNYKQAFNILKNIADNIDEEDNSIDFICFAKLLYSLICYERNEIDLMISAARSTSYFLRKYNSYFNFEKIILRFVRYTLPKIIDMNPEDQKNKFVLLKKEFEDLFNEDYGKTVVFYFDFMKWVESKIQNPLPANFTRG